MILYKKIEWNISQVKRIIMRIIVMSLKVSWHNAMSSVPWPFCKISNVILTCHIKKLSDRLEIWISPKHFFFDIIYSFQKVIWITNKVLMPSKVNIFHLKRIIFWAFMVSHSGPFFEETVFNLTYIRRYYHLSMTKVKFLVLLL